MKPDTEKLARLDESPVHVSSIPEPVVYNGTMMESLDVDATAGSQYKKGARRKVSTFNLMLVLLGSAILSVLYISNVIRVSQLLAETNKLELQHRRILMDQESLRAQVNRLSSLERVRKLGEEQIGLINPKNPPVWIKIDAEKILNVEEAVKQKSQK